MQHARTSALSHVNAYELMCAQVCRHTYLNSPTSTPPPQFFHPMHNTSFENSLAVCAVQAWDNVPEVFQGQDGCSDIRGKLHRAEADSLHVLHLPPIKRPRALSLPPSLSKCKLPPDSFSWISPRTPPPPQLSPRHSPSPRLTRLTSPGLTDELAHKVNTRFTLGSRIFI